ncbi:hypothetical protein K439DRAFT_1626211 [Ramaria rubella]|nr:hypothetical protein K439DRAFT_1626211 [Ramaria rubella]
MSAEIDVESLQAQIELSNSIAYDLVSSWMKPTTSTPADSVSHTISRQLEEYAKRPPRLGLGATIPQSTLATSREAAKLRGKLVGQKRPQDDGNGSLGQAGNSPNDDGDDDESRSTAISTKKVQMNGARELVAGRKTDKIRTPSLGPKLDAMDKSTVLVKHEEQDVSSKEKKQKNKLNLQQDTEISMPTTNPFTIPTTPTRLFSADQAIINLVSPSPERLAAVIHTPSPSKRRKKKHKKNDGNKTVIAGDDEWTGFTDQEQGIMESTALNPDEEDSSRRQPSTPTTTNPQQALKHPHSTPSSIIDLTSPAKPSPRPQHSSPLQSHPAPLLNLYDPPNVDAQISGTGNQTRGESESPKKKRKRRRGKKRKSDIREEAQ